MPESNVFITMSDGVRLAASLYIPDPEGPWPALLEALPYRKDDVQPSTDRYRRLRDEGGYVVCRVDLRGTGSSEGVALGEYLPTEQDDLCEVIAWLADQPWCTGAVGMFGTSYSGFNTIQTAMRRPPALKAILPIYATDDRYTDDIHFGGGIRKALEFVGYPLFMVSMNALPPVPSLVSDWRRRWLERIDELEPWYGSVEEQNDGPFWRQGSLRPDYQLIEVPTMIVGGWADVYRSAALRMFQHLDGPKRLLMGPWCHMSPNASIPGPRIDLVPEMIRWWDRWLKGIRNGVDEEPPVVVFVRRATPPEPDLDEMRGEWRSEAGLPLAQHRERVLPLDTAQDRPRSSADQRWDTLGVRGDVGVTAHIRGSYSTPYGLPLDQRPDEVYSLVYDWPVEEELEILGTPVLVATVRSSVPVAFVSAKLCDVLADGTSVLVSRGILNLTHRSSHRAPEPLVPGDTYEVRVELDATSWIFEPGHTLRLAIAGSDWPNAWPPPDASELTVDRARTSLMLPEVGGPSPEQEAPHLTSVERGANRPDDEAGTWRIERDVYARETRVVVDQRFTNDLEGCTVSGTEGGIVGVTPMTPGTAWVESETDYEIECPEVKARAHARLHLRTDPTSYAFALDLDVYENELLIRSRHWERTTPRAHQ